MPLRMTSPVGAKTSFNGEQVDYFSGCSYLGLQNHPEVVAAAAEAVQRFGLATGTSRGGYGEHPLYDELEREVCAYFDSEAMLYFASGYLGNTILVQGFFRHYDRIFVDAASHFSVWDGAHTVDAPVSSFRHCDPEDLAVCLSRELKPGERPLILTDGVFPISGEIAPIPDYLRVLGDREGLICLDDAHATGVLGENGRGTLDHFGIMDQRCFASHTLSKALGAYGGVIPGTEEQIAELVRRSKVYVAASPPPLPVAAAAATALALTRRDLGLRQRLWENVARAREGFRRLGWPLADTPVPILCLGTQQGLDLEVIKNKLFARGIAVAHVTTYSSTPPGGCLRVAIFADHTTEQIDRLLGAVAELV